MGGFDVSFAGAFAAGVLSFLSPCVLPLVPPYLCFLGGVSLEQITGDEQVDRRLWRRVMFTALLFVLGFSTVFITLGATASLLGELLADNIDLLSKIAGVVIILLGLHFLGVFKFAFLNRDVRFRGPNRPAGWIGAYMIGLAFAFGWTPCVGPVLAAILMVAGGESSVSYGVSLLTVYSLGLGLPFLIAAAMMKPFMALMVRFRSRMVWIERGIGALLVATGLLFLSGTFSALAYWLLEAVPVLGRIG
ncbi:MAG: cytochrome c biogenesis protein CcdA [Alphaproteobacteria bacterium]|nr:cytochrome c biogenesis protein CcdA [Alphaproteobacteria bacterium]MBL6951263.1 cytochrome c biogenesis protein CcdA [Alphaproteobacteria bacterium]